MPRAESSLRGLKEFRYRFELDLASSPEQLWPLVSDTDRFNRDTGVPAVERRGTGPNARRSLRLTRFGLPVEWEEEPFEWVSPRRFSVLRRYTKGPVASLRTRATLDPRPEGGTRLVYEVEATPRNVLGLAAIPAQIGVLSRRRFLDAFRSYDATARNGTVPLPAPKVRLAPGGKERLEAARRSLLDGGASPELAGRLCDVVEHGDDLTVSRLRPYALADEWGADRRRVLELCLWATRAGLLELHWELLCPSCRGAASSEASLDAVGRQLHCETCLIDFSADFDRSVEVTFTPVASVRHVERLEFCVGGPQLTPHVVAQQLVPPGEERLLALALEPGSYRVHAFAERSALRFRVAADGAGAAAVRLTQDGWAGDEVTLGPQAELSLANATGVEQLLVLERTAWSDQTATAAEVTALQVFRDLFAAEALRPGEPIAVRSLSVVFTDLRGSTRYYRDVGDAPAFGSVVEHLAVLRQEVAAEGGAVVKALGDAIMAVFPRPVCAVQAMLSAQRAVAGKPLELKVGIHAGRCIAVNQNGVLDYFGSTVNLAARLVGLSGGGDLILSDAVLEDTEVAALGLRAEPVEGVLKGFEDEPLSLWRVVL